MKPVCSSILKYILFAIVLFCISCTESQSPEFTVIDDLPSLSPRANEAKRSAEFLALAQMAEKLRNKIVANPEIADNYVDLAQLFLHESRMSNNHHEYLPKAQSLIRKAQQLDPENFMALVSEAAILLIQHRFLEAEKVIETALRIDDQTATAYGVLCDVKIELGKYGEAVAACDKMLQIRPDLRAYARAAYLRELHGNVRDAIVAMGMAVNAGVPGREDRAWALNELGNLYFEKGAVDTAALIYNGILEERPGYLPAQKGLANIEAASAAYDNAIDILVTAMIKNPDHSLLEKLADFYLQKSDSIYHRQMLSSVLNAFQAHQADGWNIRLDYAKFCLNHNIQSTKSLAYAAQEFKNRPDNIDVLDTYAWALYKNGEYPQAATMINRALRLGTERFELLYHAGVIFNANGEQSKAAAYLEKALQINADRQSAEAAHSQNLLAEIQQLAENQN